MATYAIGDIQGCYDSLRYLLDEIRFEPGRDRLWLTGDLVNRGPKSLKTLRFVRSLDDAVVTVLGNHDLHLLALATGAVKYSARFASLRKVLDAPDLEELVDWLRGRPFAHYWAKHDTLLVHAGIHPSWSVKKTLKLSQEVEAALAASNYRKLLSKMYGNTPRRWSDKLTGYARLRFIINALTRMRMLTLKTSLNFAHTGSPWRARSDLKPWYAFDDAAWGETRIVFGHWSALGLMVLPGVVSLDTGCVWGRQLTAVRIDKKIPRILQVAAQERP